MHHTAFARLSPNLRLIRRLNFSEFGQIARGKPVELALVVVRWITLHLVPKIFDKKRLFLARVS